MTQTIEQLQRYKVGYYTDEWGMSSNTPCLIKDTNGYAVRFEDVKQLQARVAELEAENAHMKEVSECHAIDLRERDAAIRSHCDAKAKLREQLAAAQADNKRLRDAVDKWCKFDSLNMNLNEWRDFCAWYNSLPIDTSALDAYVAEKVKEAVRTIKESEV